MRQRRSRGYLRAHAAVSITLVVAACAKARNRLVPTATIPKRRFASSSAVATVVPPNASGRPASVKARRFRHNAASSLNARLPVERFGP
jgi:hypothetical protein